jgi:hypothetical protein
MHSGRLNEGQNPPPKRKSARVLSSSEEVSLHVILCAAVSVRNCLRDDDMFPPLSILAETTVCVFLVYFLPLWSTLHLHRASVFQRQLPCDFHASRRG